MEGGDSDKPLSKKKQKIIAKAARKARDKANPAEAIARKEQQRKAIEERRQKSDSQPKAVPPPSERMQVLQETREQIRKRRTRPLDKSLKVEFKGKPGDKGRVFKSLVDITEEMSKSQTYRKIKEGNLHSVPVVELRTMKHPEPDEETGEMKFEKGKPNTIDSEPITTPMDKLAEELRFLYEKLKEKGETLKIKKFPGYIKYHQYQDKAAEVKIRNAMETALKKLGMPAVLVRGMHMTETTIKILQKFGFLTSLPKRRGKKVKTSEKETEEVEGYTATKVEPSASNVTKKLKEEKKEPQSSEDVERVESLNQSGKAEALTTEAEALTIEAQPLTAAKELKEWEADILAAYVWGATLRIIVGEVKRKSKNLWDNSKTKLDRETRNKALDQLKTDMELVQALLEDFPATSIELHYVAMFPETEVSELEGYYPNHMEHVIGQEDLAHPDILREKLNLPDSSNPPAVEAIAEEMLLALFTRIFGPTRVYLGHRFQEDRARVEEAKMHHNVETVDRQVHVLLPVDQWELIKEARTNRKSIIFTGGPGTGKTELLKAACKESAPEVLIITAYQQRATSPLMKHLKQEMYGQAPEVLALPWRDLLERMGLMEEDYRTGGKSSLGINALYLPSLFLDLCRKVKALYPNQRVSIGVDEVLGMLAPQTARQYDWTQLTNAFLPPSITLLLTINPKRDLPLRCTSTSDTFLVINSNITYRSTDNLATFSQRLEELLQNDQKRNVVKATDVKGPLPTIVDMGKVKEVGRMGEEVREAITRLKSEGRGKGTVVHDAATAEAAARRWEMVKKVAGAEGWDANWVGDFHGWEDDTIIYAGAGSLEAVSRARVRLVVLLAWDRSGFKAREVYDEYSPAMQQLVREGLAEERAPATSGSRSSNSYADAVPDCRIE